MDQGQPYLVGSIDKALTVVRLLRERGSMGVSELGTELSVARSTAHRILGTLMHHGFVEQDRLTRAYRLGPFLTGMRVEPGSVSALRQQAKPYMRELSALLRETVLLMVLEAPNCRFVDGVSGGQPLNTTVRAGTRVPAYATAGGKVLLAQLSDAQVHRLFPAQLAALTDRTIQTSTELLNQLRLIRKNDFAVNEGESETGICAVAVPIRDAQGVTHAALSMSMPSVRMRKEDVPTLAAELRRCARRIITMPLDATP